MVLPLIVGSTMAQHTAETLHGNPFTKFYSFEEIGNASRGARLSFDSRGRLALVRSGACMVLNDSTWIDIADKHVAGAAMQRVVFDSAGNAYYGAFASWGLAEITPGDVLHPRSLVPASYPEWVMASSFTEIIPTDSGVYFAGFSGIVYWDRKSGEHVFIEIPQLMRIFEIGDAVFALSRIGGIQSVDIKNQTVHPMKGTGLDGELVDQVTAFDHGRVLLATTEGRLLTFDGRNFAAWAKSSAGQPTGRVSALKTLSDGRVAVAISGKGLYFFSEQGDICYSLTTPDYQRITDLASREDGVLWISNESGVEKILYQNPLTIFGQRLGLPVSWPQVVQWNDHIVVASGGLLYEASASSTGDAARFEVVMDQPKAEVWGIAAQDSQMLVGNHDGVFVRNQNGKFEAVLTGINVARLVMVNPTLCYAIGPKEIAALRRSEGHWAECAERVPGLGYPSWVHAAKLSAWIELGANRAARVVLKNGTLQVRVFDHFPWAGVRWVNIGIVGDTVVLSGLPNDRVYFDEQTETLIATSSLQQLFDRAPQTVARVTQDKQGTIWASYEQGFMMIHSQGNDFQIDQIISAGANDHYPLIQLLPNGEAWLATSQSLYHVNRQLARATTAACKPVLISAVDGRTNLTVFQERQGNGLPVLKFAQNSLVFRFFAGSYALYPSPAYEFRLNRGSDSWSPLGSGSSLTLTDLREGTYRLDVRLTNSPDPIRDSLSFQFEISPPWYRTWPAYLCYCLCTAATILALIRMSAHQSRARNAELEKLVEERTEALRVAMQQLTEETRNAATLAERDRLAGEIHDSLQQGLTGLLLQLDATLKLPDLSGDVRSRLSVARNMVSFTGHEVQHAVWDMGTPLLEGTELDEALRKITSQISLGTARVEIVVTGRRTQLSPVTKHHLRRIAQEAITNAVRHAAASTIIISLDYTPDSVSLRVIDNGNGFVPNDVLYDGIGHFGLRGLRGRAAKIGGELNIQSAPGEGTTVTVTVQQTSDSVLSYANNH